MVGVQYIVGCCNSPGLYLLQRPGTLADSATLPASSLLTHPAEVPEHLDPIGTSVLAPHPLSGMLCPPLFMRLAPLSPSSLCSEMSPPQSGYAILQLFFCLHLLFLSFEVPMKLCQLFDVFVCFHPQ